MRLLGLALAASMAVAVVGIMVVSADLLADSLIEQGARSQQADAASIEAAVAEAGRGEEPLDEAAEVVEGLANRPDIHSVHLVDSSCTVVAADDPKLHSGSAWSPTRSRWTRTPRRWTTRRWSATPRAATGWCAQ